MPIRAGSTTAATRVSASTASSVAAICQGRLMNCCAPVLLG
jgi:hypothetical protein